jgi:hypothetical protein
MLNIQFLSQKHMLGYGTTQLRCVPPSMYLIKKGWSVSLGRINSTLPSAADVVIYHRIPFNGTTEKYLRYAKSKGLAIVYDTDDLIFDALPPDNGDSVGGEKSEHNANANANANASAASIRLAMINSDVIFLSTSFLAEKARCFHPDVCVVNRGVVFPLNFLIRHCYISTNSIEA